MTLTLRHKLFALLAAAAMACGTWLALSGETTDDYGRTALMRAAERGDDAEVRRLLSRGARMNHQVPSDDLEAFIALLGFFQEYPANKVGWTPLMFAVAGKHEAVARTLLQRGADPGLRARSGESALWLAVSGDSPELVKALLQAGAPPDGGGAQGFLVTPLFLCAGLPNAHAAEIASLLVDAGASRDAVNRDGATPLIVAVRNGNVEVAQVLAAAGADLAARDREPGWTALMWATHLADRARRGGADAVTRGLARYEALEKLLREGPRGDAGGAGDATFGLVRAIQAEDPEAVRAALADGADPDAELDHGQPALFAAAVRGQAEAVRALLAAGANPHARHRDRGVLGAAVAGRSLDAVQALLDTGQPAADLQDALRQSAMYGQAEIVAALLGAGASADMGDYPLLQQAVRWGNAETIRHLLQAGADPNLKGEGQTALAAAVSYGKLDVVRELVAAGADPDIPDSTGKLPMDFVRRVASLENAPEDYRRKYAEIGELLASARR